MSKRSNKPILLKTAVLARAMTGESNSQISRDLGIDRNTVATILSDAEFRGLTEQAKSRCAMILPKAVTAVEGQLDRGDGDLGLRFLEKMRVVGEEAKPSVNVNVGVAIGDMPRMRVFAQSVEADKSVLQAAPVP